MTTALKDDPSKQESMKWWLAQAIPDWTPGSARRERDNLLRMMKMAEKGQYNLAMEVLALVASYTGNHPYHSEGYWAYGQFNPPGLVIKGYRPPWNRSERWDLCWTGQRWEFDVKESRRGGW